MIITKFKSLNNELDEELQDNMPSERGISFTMRSYVDSDHAGDMVTRRSRTGFLIFLNSAHIYWWLKKHFFLETSSFG